MFRKNENDNAIYKVVLNDQKQYAIWPINSKNPLGWEDVGKSGSRSECSAYIEELRVNKRYIIKGNPSSSEFAFINSTLVDVLRYRANHQPDQIAFTFLVDGDTEKIHITYKELDLRAQLIAAKIQTLVRAGERALLLYPPGLDYINAFFGCLYAGVVAVPAYPPRPNRFVPELDAIINSSRSTLALTTDQIHSGLVHDLEHFKYSKSIHWLTTNDITLEQDNCWQEPDINSKTLAYLQYTSGSTSIPKGVMITHSNVIHYLTFLRRFAPTQKLETLQGVWWMPPYHDGGLIGGIIQPLYDGFPMTLMPPVAFVKNPFHWLKAISDAKATFSGGPNFAYDLCVDRITPEQRKSLDLSSWSMAFVSAEPIHHNTLTRFSATFEECGFNSNAYCPAYGLAEATLLFTCHQKMSPPIYKTFQKSAKDRDQVIEVSPESQDSITLVSSGQAMGVHQILIVNPETLSRCLPDQIGEIWVSGEIVADGYWDRSRETEHTFRAYLLDTGEGPFLRTGDLGFIRDGELFVTGRIKEVIIIRGRKHYPQDIEYTVWQSNPSLQPGSSAAFSIEIDGQEKLVIVQEIKRSHRNLDVNSTIASIRKAVAENHELQIYAVILVKPMSIPKTTSGKTQRLACKEEFQKGNLNVVGEWQDTKSAHDLIDTVSAPKTDIEKVVTAIVAHALDLEISDIDVDANFFELGIDSLRAAQIISRLSETFQVDLPVGDFFRTPTIASISRRVESSRQREPVSNPLAIQSVLLQTAEVPASFAQERLWFLDQLQPGTPIYNLPLAAQFTGNLNILALEQSLNEIVGRHQALRTNFATVNGKPVQIVRPPCSVNINRVDLSMFSESERRAEAYKIMTQEAQKAFDLKEDLLIRAILITLNEHDYIIGVVIHHVVADGWSVGIFIQELVILYQAFSKFSPSPLPELPVQYADFAVWQRHWLQGGVLDNLIAYWNQQLGKDLPKQMITPDHPMPKVRTHSGGSQSFNLSRSVSDAIKTISRREEVTLFMTLLSAFYILIHHYSNQDDIVVGTDVANRDRVEIEPLIGFFMNILVLRAKVDGHKRFGDFLRQIRDVALDAYAHQGLPFGKLVETLRLTRDPDINPLFQVLFVLQNSPMPVLELPDLTIKSLEVDNGMARFDLALFMTETEQGLIGTWRYDTDLYDAVTISKLTKHYEVLINNITARPNALLNELDILSEEEKTELLLGKKKRQEYDMQRLRSAKRKVIDLSQK